jgi:signal transduction histidine kinase
LLYRKQNKDLMKLNRHRAGPKPYRLRTARHADKIPGFIYTASISSTDFHPISCAGGLAALTGHPISSFLRKNFYNKSVVAPKDAEPLQKFRFAVKSSTVPGEISYKVITKQGKSVNVSEQIVLIGSDGPRKLIGGIVTLSGKSAHSISLGGLERDKVRFEEMEKLNRHLLEINQLKDEFLANTSHELRTPLNSIIGFLTLITEGYYEGDNELRLFTRNALDSSYHLLSVINDLLDISKIEAGKMQLQIEKVYVDELIEDVALLFKIQADQKGLSLEYTTKEHPLFAAADVRKLKQVLINLAGNAVKFTSSGGVKISVESHDSQLMFAIKDTGIGIPREKHDKLFQKFIQVDGSATRRFGGSGLGLVISKHLVEMMGGHIEIESKGAGTGTTVLFTIPKWTKEDN